MKAKSKHLRHKIQNFLETLWNNPTQPKEDTGVARRDFLKWSALAGTGASIAGALSAPAVLRAETRTDSDDVPTRFNEATVAELQAAMASGETSSAELTHFYLRRIRALDKDDQDGPGVNSIIEVNPDALVLAHAADELREQGKVLGPLHGIPVLLKDNIDTGDRMQTTAGSFALAGVPAVQDSTVAAKLRAGGAVILGKTTLSEWANFRSFNSISGWSGRGGQCNNPYGIARNPSGSSSGSAAAASANLTAVSLGTETDGSIVSPACVSGVVGIKPTVGLTSRAGVVPISHTQDTVGPHARTVADAAAVLSVIASHGPDGRDPATGGVPLGWRGRFTRPANLPTDYTQFLNPNGLSGTRIGVTRAGLNGFDPNAPTPQSVLNLFENAVTAIQGAGATLVDLEAQGFTFPPGNGEFLVLVFDFVSDLRNYFATRVGVPMAGKTLADAIAFNNANAAVEMPFFAQEIFDLAQSLATGPDDPQPAFGGMTYNQALDIDRLATVNGIDLALSKFSLDGIVSATGTTAWPTDLIFGDRFFFGTSNLAAIGGYPIINVPLGNLFGLPMGISFFGTAFSEPTLIKLASGFEHATKARIVPQFLDDLPAGKHVDPNSKPVDRNSSTPRRRDDAVEQRRPHHM
ncbi:MAG TPA: amidase [Terriglobales bacterium]|jgi:amidase|nr:amidase [Terriglobales bacterium]